MNFLQNIAARFRSFMVGRYGTDQLNLALLIAYLVFCIITSLTGWQVFNILALVSVLVCFFRMLSRDHYKRAEENRKFLIKMQPVFLWWNRTRARMKDKDHRYYKCPCCKQTLRVPSGRGRIKITCPRCRTEIVKKT